MVKRFFFRLFCVYCFFFFVSGAGFPFKGLFVGFFGLGSYVGFVGVCFWVSNERVVRDFSESFFLSVSWDPGGPNVYFSRVFVRDLEAVF